VPTGVALRDVREQLFGAAERVLLRDGPSALTSRAVTDEAGVAKGVLHRHFADFDEFLAELVHDRAAKIRAQSAALLDSAGTGTVAGNLAGALTDLFGSVADAILALVIFRDELRARLRATWPRGIPLTREITEMVGDYLTAERDLGRRRGHGHPGGGADAGRGHPSPLRRPQRRAPRSRGSPQGRRDRRPRRHRVGRKTSRTAARTRVTVLAGRERAHDQQPITRPAGRRHRAVPGHH
jgi:AcrR family transcriptional regulator